MTNRVAPGMLAGPGIMILSAVIFGYFGFSTQWEHHDRVTGELVVWVPMLEWTLKGSALVFVLSALLTFPRPLVGNMLFSAVGLLGAILFVVVAIMDWTDKQHGALPPVLLLIFAAWNGYGSWTGLQAVLAVRRVRAEFEPPEEGFPQP